MSLQCSVCTNRVISGTEEQQHESQPSEPLSQQSKSGFISLWSAAPSAFRLSYPSRTELFMYRLLSLAGAATSIIFVATNTCLSRQNTCLSRQNTHFVVTNVCLSRQTYFGRDRTFDRETERGRQTDGQTGERERELRTRNFITQGL